jgi:aquaporin NIP
MRKYVAEAIGTFAIVFCGTGAIIIDQQTNGVIGNTDIAITFGLIVTTMIYGLGHISGAHFNPAVSIAFCIAKKFPTTQLLPYIISQITGGLLASTILHFLFPANELLGTTLPSGSVGQSFVLETILTFLLMLVILYVSQGSKEKGMFAGLAIGIVVGLEALFAGPTSGASMNPARSLAPALVSGHTEHLWVYLTATVLGACLAVPIYKYLNKD